MSCPILCSPKCPILVIPCYKSPQRLCSMEEQSDGQSSSCDGMIRVPRYLSWHGLAPDPSRPLPPLSATLTVVSLPTRALAPCNMKMDGTGLNRARPFPDDYGLSAVVCPLLSVNRCLSKQTPLAMECLSCAPDEDAGQDNEEGGPNHLLVISDCNGRCDFVSAFSSSAVQCPPLHCVARRRVR